MLVKYDYNPVLYNLNSFNTLSFPPDLSFHLHKNNLWTDCEKNLSSNLLNLSKITTNYPKLDNTDITNILSSVFTKNEIKNSTCLNFNSIKKDAENPTCYSNLTLSKIGNENSVLNRIKKGSIVFFSHINKLTHLAIQESQKLLNKGWHDFFNVTHAGIVVDVSEEHIQVSEIPGMGKKLSQNVYNFKDLSVGDNLLFINGVHEKLTKRIVEVAKLWTNDELNGKPENQYNLKDILFQPINYIQSFSGKKIDLESKYRVVEAFIDTFVLGHQPLDSQENYQIKRKFFCSEFVVEVYQMAWLEEHASLPQDIKEIKTQLNLPIIDSAVRKKIVNDILSHWDNLEVWKRLATSEVIGFPAKDSSPSALITDASKMGTLNKIEGTGKRNLDAYVEHAEYALTRALDLYLSGEEMRADHPDVLVGLDFLENRVKISKKTISCLNQTSEDISDCVTQSLKWHEKFGTYLVTREISRVLEKFLKEEIFDKIAIDTFKELNQLAPDFLEIQDKTINKLLPTRNMDLASLENYIINYVLKNTSPEVATKYVLLAVISDSSNHSIQQQLKDIINHQNFSLSRLHAALCSNSMDSQTVFCDGNSALYVKIAESVIKKMIRDKLPPQKAAMETLMNLQGTQELEEGLLHIEATTGYNQNTLNCVMKDFINSNPVDIKECLETTLTVSEKLGILMSSYRSNDGLDNFVDTPLAKMLISKEEVDVELLNQLAARMNNNPDEFLLDLFFPLNVDGYIQWATNKIYRYQIGQLTPNVKKQQILKYIPLGLHLQKPSEKVNDFIEALSKSSINPKIAEKLPFTKAISSLISLYKMGNSTSLIKIYEKLNQYL